MAERLLLIAALTLAACGGSETPQLAPTLRMSSALRAELRAVGVYVYGPYLSSGDFLTCASLELHDLNPTDARLDVLDSTTVEIADPNEPPPIELSAITSGEGRIVYVAAIDAGDLVIGIGCAEGITVGVDEDVNVDITVREP